MQIYFNPLDCACKSKLGAVCREEKLQFNIYLLKKDSAYKPYNAKAGEFCAKTPERSQCMQPKQKAFLRILKPFQQVLH